jgi:hypothetical protein
MTMAALKIPIGCAVVCTLVCLSPHRYTVDQLFGQCLDALVRGAGIFILLTKAEAAFEAGAGTRRRAIENSYTAKVD